MVERRGYFFCYTKVMLNRGFMVGLTFGRMDKAWTRWLDIWMIWVKSPGMESAPATSVNNVGNSQPVVVSISRGSVSCVCGHNLFAFRQLILKLA